MSHPRVKIILNPLANQGKACAAKELFQSLAARSIQAEWFETHYSRHAIELAASAASEGYNLVIAIGGDGTIHEVVNGLMQTPPESRPHLGIVPMGSGNDFSYSFGLPAQPEEALIRALTGTPRPVDIGFYADNAGRQEYWVNVVGIGFDAAVNLRSRRLKGIPGFAVYFVAALQTIFTDFKPFHVRSKQNGHSSEEEVIWVIFSNGKREGSVFHVAPQAELSDGMLNQLTVNAISAPTILYSLPFFMKGSQHRLPWVSSSLVEKITLHTSRPVTIHSDGEIFAGFDSAATQIEIQTIPHAIQVRC